MNIHPPPINVLATALTITTELYYITGGSARVQRVSQKTKFLIFSLTVLVCITKINLHYRSLAVLTENGFQQIIFDSSIVAGSSSRPFTFFEVNMCESNMKVSITFDQVRKYLKVSQKKPKTD